MRSLLITLTLVVGLTSCSSFEGILKSKDINYKMTKANEYYNKGSYFEASRIYENILPQFRGAANYEELYYKFAYSFYKDGDYLNAAYQFKNYTEFFSKSPKVEEMQFMYAVSLFKDSRKVSLDQEETEKAIAALQNFIAVHASSDYVEDANRYLNTAYAKLETKAAAAAAQYYHLDDYRSASVAYKTLIYDFPDSKDLDYYYYMVQKSLYKYAENSKIATQLERYMDANSYYDLLKTYFPKTSFINEANKLNTLALNKIKELKK